MKKQFIYPVILLLAAAIWVGIVFWPSEPTQWPLCNTLKRHAPCLVNLSTGEVCELELYQPHHTKVGEIAKVQDSSTFSYIHAAGLQGIRTTSPYIIEIRIPMGSAPVQLKSFCKNCRQTLVRHPCGYALVDLYDLDNPVAYKIYDGAEYDLRCYQITIEQDPEKATYLLTVTGTLGD